MNSAPESRPCGLYRTTIALSDPADTIGADTLVYFHNHSKQGPPMLLLPAGNTHNRWRFREDGFLVSDTDYVATLEILLPEGLYRVREHFHPDEERIVAANSLVQLGYTSKAVPLIFFPTRSETPADLNAVAFPDQGMRIPPKVYALLEALDVRGPHTPTRLN